MILIINLCREKLHSLEFVKPIEDILAKGKLKFFTKNYLEINKKDLANANKIIICGTSLKDNSFLKQIKRFEWLRNFDKPLLGICAGMHIIGLVFNGKLIKKTEIGSLKLEFKKNFLGLLGQKNVYSLHNYWVSFPKNFEKFAASSCIQAIKHKNKEIYGVLFHPEVRHKNLITTFCNL